jgi:hypothetical protein
MPQARPAASVSIHAPLDTVWAVMTDVAAYGEWNPFVHRVECPTPPRPGDAIVLHVRWPHGRSSVSPERISLVEPPYQDEATRRAALAYSYEGLPSRLGLVRGTRYQRLSQVAGGVTVYDTVEEFSGPLVPLAGPARVAEGFRRHAEALKVRAEQLSGPREQPAP